MLTSPLSVVVPEALAARAQRAGFVLSNTPATVPSTPEAVLTAWAEGQRAVVCAVETTEQLFALRPLTLFAACFGEILITGEFTPRRASGGLEAALWQTRQRGSLLLVTNLTAEVSTGSVFPLAEALTLPAGGALAWLHDTPIGAAQNYLGAYAGIVKSDAQVVSAQIRPDPFEGVRVFVTASVGTQKELVLFNAGPGEAHTLSFSDTPTVTVARPSQLIALPLALAQRLWVSADGQPTWIGAEDVLDDGRVVAGPHPLWSLDAAGTLTEIEVGEEAALSDTPGWWITTIGGDDEPRTAQLHFKGVAPEAVWLNGERLTGTELTLVPGENRLVVRQTAPQSFGPVTVTLDGACFLLELTQWRFWEAQSSQ